MVSCGESVGVGAQSFVSDSGQSECSGVNIWVVYVWSASAPTDSGCDGNGPDNKYPSFDCMAVGPLPRTI